MVFFGCCHYCRKHSSEHHPEADNARREKMSALCLFSNMGAGGDGERTKFAIIAIVLATLVLAGEDDDGSEDDNVDGDEDGPHAADNRDLTTAVLLAVVADDDDDVRV